MLSVAWEGCSSTLMPLRLSRSVQAHSDPLGHYTEHYTIWFGTAPVYFRNNVCRVQEDYNAKSQRFPHAEFGQIHTFLIFPPDSDTGCTEAR